MSKVKQERAERLARANELLSLPREVYCPMYCQSHSRSTLCPPTDTPIATIANILHRMEAQNGLGPESVSVRLSEDSMRRIGEELRIAPGRIYFLDSPVVEWVEVGREAPTDEAAYRPEPLAARNPKLPDYHPVR